MIQLPNIGDYNRKDRLSVSLNNGASYMDLNPNTRQISFDLNMLKS